MEMVVVVLAWIVGSYVVLDFGFGKRQPPELDL
jgi:hypothetical protein